MLELTVKERWRLARHLSNFYHGFETTVNDLFWTSDAIDSKMPVPTNINPVIKVNIENKTGLVFSLALTDQQAIDMLRQAYEHSQFYTEQANEFLNECTHKSS